MSLGSQALTGFTLFLKDVRPCYLAHHNATEEDANRFLAAVWEAMCPPAKEPYEALATEQRKAIIAGGMAPFALGLPVHVPVSMAYGKEGQPSRVALLQPPEPAKPRRKDPHAPKRAMSAYLCFIQEQMPIAKQAHREASNKELFAALSARWRELTEEERKVRQQKGRYKDAAAVDRQRYERERELYAQGKFKRGQSKGTRTAAVAPSAAAAPAATVVAPGRGPEAAAAPPLPAPTPVLGPSAGGVGTLASHHAQHFAAAQAHAVFGGLDGAPPQVVPGHVPGQEYAAASSQGWNSSAGVMR